MKKYLEIAKAYMKAQLIWRSDTLVDVILAVAKILFAWILWSILFEGKEQIAGLGFQAMISYYIISSYLFQLAYFQGCDPGVSFISEYNPNNGIISVLVSNYGDNVWREMRKIREVLY